MSGPAAGAHDDRGLCARTIDYLFLAMRSISDSEISVKFSAIEIYNDVASDLLRFGDSKETPKLIIVDSPSGVLVPDLFLFPISSPAEGHHKLYEANVNRCVLPLADV